MIRVVQPQRGFVRRHLFPVLILLATLFCFAPPSHASYDPAARFQEILSYYQQRLLGGGDGRERANWLLASRALQQLQRENPEHEVAPQSLYLLGNLHHRLYRQSGNSLDLAEAVTFFEDMQATYPRHRLAPDALFYLANIFLHDRQEPERAGRTLARIVALYPESELAGEARRQLTNLRQPPGPAAPLPPAAVSGELELAEVLPLRHWSSDTYTRVVIESSSPLTFRSRMLANGQDSRRLQIDLAGARLSPRITSPQSAAADGLLRQMHLNQLTPDSVRVTLDTQAAIDDYKIFNLDNPPRVVIDLLGKPTPPPVRVVRPAQPPKSAPPPPARVEPGEPIRPPLSLAQQLGFGIRRVVIDPGHGGKDPGAISPNGLKEKDITLQISKLLAAVLERQGSEVILTRDRDIFLPLEERTAIANSREADLFISIHVNSANNRQAQGVETYILDMVASDDEAMRVAARENASSARSFNELQGIVHQLLNHAKLNESMQLAEMVQQTMVESLRRVYGPQIQDRGIRRAPFVVLIGARMPALLVEVGFLSNPEEERRLQDQRYLEQLVQSIADGIQQYAAHLSLATR